jgi:MoxR-like ATPase
MMRIDVSYPPLEDETAVLNRYGTIASTEEVVNLQSAAVGAAQLASAREHIDQTHVSPEVVAYVLAIAKASREQAQVALGLSTRGALALLRAARVAAALRGSDFVTPDDVKLVVPWVVPHRLTLSATAALEGRTDQAVARTLLERVPVPR